MGAVIPLIDGLRNLVANLGTSRDKAYHSHYVYTPPSPAQLLSAYRGAWLARKIVDIPAMDACREWRAWQAEADQIALIEAEEKRLGLQRKVQQAMTVARLYGGAAIYIGAAQGDPAEPIDLDAIQRGGLTYITVLTPNDISAGRLSRDPASEWFGKPEIWTITGLQGAAPTRVHPSRLAIFHGAALPAGERSGNGWGDSALAAVMDAMTHADSTTANIASLIFEAKIDVMKIPGLMKNVRDKTFEAALKDRLALAATMKGINGTLIMDEAESYDQKSASFSALGDLMDRFFQNVSGAADIPMTRLFGQAPAGMSATGESDLRNYYDRIAAMQSLEIGPAMWRLDEAIVRSALGERPPEVWYRWASLWQMGEKERAEIGKITAETMRVLNDGGLLPTEVIAKAGASAIIETGAFPGLDAAIKEYGLGNDGE